MRVAGVFAGAQETREFQAGDVVFAQGDTGEEMFGIVEGSVELRVDGEPIAVLGPGDVFGEMALIDRTERMATASVMAPSQIVSIDRRRFLFLVHETPTFALQVMSALAERLRPSSST